MALAGCGPRAWPRRRSPRPPAPRVPPPKLPRRSSAHSGRNATSGARHCSCLPQARRTTASAAICRRFSTAELRSRRRLTDSGVHYVPFSHPAGPQGAGSVVLHVADGSQLISQRVDGDKLTVRVGAGGGERYGSCLERLTTPRLRDGWLPVLQTAYVDGLGVRYRQESFAEPFGAARLAGLVQLVVDARRASITPPCGSRAPPGSRSRSARRPANSVRRLAGRRPPRPAAADRPPRLRDARTR